MKDLYSFCADEEEHKVFYEQCAEAYMRIFDRIGIGEKTYRTFASGGAFAEFSGRVSNHSACRRGHYLCA